ncbi:MAG: hypothetical protein H7249_09390 [Chitinophagaceae bacterium]|nr:hypothetical protein [Oligoflexus sp.]
MVRHARGDAWKTCGDGELYVASKATDPFIAFPMEAVEVSLLEVLEAFRSHAKPIAIYKATLIVPFIDQEEQSLASTFAPDMSEDELLPQLKRLGMMWTLGHAYHLNEPLIRKYFEAIPSLMTEFQKNVTEEAKPPALAKALPAALIQGYETIR